MKMKKSIIASFFILTSFLSYGQITVNTPFQPNVAENIDKRANPINTLADTLTISFPYEDLRVWVRSESKVYRYTGNSWQQVLAGSISDGDKGDITVSSSGDTLLINQNSVGSNEISSTGVVAGSYTIPSITIDEDGRIISANNGLANSSVVAQSVFTRRGFRFLDQKMSNREQVSIGFFGDSNTENPTRFISGLKNVLKRKGLEVNQNWQHIRDLDTEKRTGFDVSYVDSLYSVKYFAAEGTTGDTAQFSNFNAFGNALDGEAWDTAYIFTGGSNFELEVKVDNTPIDTITSNGYTKTLVTASNGPHNLTLTVLSDTVLVYGVWFNDSTDISLYNWGASGQGAFSQKNIDSTALVDQINTAKTDLVLINIGTNDMPVSDAGTYMSDFKEIYDKISSANTEIGIVIPIERVGIAAGRAKEYRDSLVAFADSKGINYIDMYSFYNPVDTRVTDGIYDGLHYTTQGGNLNGELFADAIFGMFDFSDKISSGGGGSGGVSNVDSDTLGAAIRNTLVVFEDGNTIKPDYSIRIANGQIGFGDTPNGAAIDISANGLPIKLSSWSSSTQPTTNLRAGLIGWSVSTSKPEWYNGSSWVSPALSSGNFAADRVAVTNANNQVLSSPFLTVSGVGNSSTFGIQGSSTGFLYSNDFTTNTLLISTAAATGNSFIDLQRTRGTYTSPSNLDNGNYVLGGIRFRARNAGISRIGTQILSVGTDQQGASFYGSELQFFTSNGSLNANAAGAKTVTINYDNGLTLERGDMNIPAGSEYQINNTPIFITGSSSGTTDVSGDIIVSHTLGVTPSFVEVSNTSSTAFFFSVTAKTSSNFTLRVFDATGAAASSSSVAFDFKAVN